MRKLTLSLAVLAALLPSHVLPLGLGEIELNSALNQELKAEIEVLSAAPEDAEQLIVKLASREAFARAGIDRPFSLQDLKFKTIVKGNKPYIQVYTTESVREPFLSFLVEVDWPNGHLLREYTLLLDPPVFNSGAAAPATPMDAGPGDQDQTFFEPADVSAEPAATSERDTDLDALMAAELQGDAGTEPAPAEHSIATMEDQSGGADAMPVLPQSTAAATMGATSTASQQSAAVEHPAPRYSQQVSGEYRVQEHDTLWSLAEKFRPNSDVTVEQMMLALVQENPESFIKENIHGLKRGYILRMPDSNNVTAVDRKTALVQVAQHTALWREYRQSMSSSVPASAMEAEETTSNIPAPASDGRLNIVSAAGATGSEGAAAGQDPKSQVTQLKRELSLARETLESERLEKENLRERLAELESRVQRVMEMDDTELAKLQSDLTGTRKQADKVLKPDAKTAPADKAPVASGNKPAVPAEKSVVPETAPGSKKSPLFIDEAPAPVTDQAVATDETETPAPAPQQTSAPVTPEPGLLDNPLTLAIIAGVTVLVGALAFVFVRRRRAAAEDAEIGKWSDMDQPINFDDAVEAVGEPFVRPRNPDSTAEMHDDITRVKPKAAPAMQDTAIMAVDEPAETEVRDDVLAESDVYLAYGIYQQAEELLRNALKTHPERDDYRMKLLETHFASKNASAFAELANVAKQRKGSVKTYWDRVVVMGRELCPGDQMFGSDAVELPDFDAGDLLPQKPQTTDFELDAGGMAPDLDLGFTENKSAPGSKANLDMDIDFTMDADATTILREPPALKPEPAVTTWVEPELEFDLAADLENIANSMRQVTPAAATKARAPADDLDLGELDFGSDALTMNVGGTEVIDDDFALDFEASDLGLAFDEPGDVAGMDTSLDLAMDADMDLGADLTADLDMSDLTIEDQPAAKPAAARKSAAVGIDDDFDISQLADDVDEVSTKLDLARAYMDMGDNEGARNILEEVKSEGNSAQKKQAAELMAKAS